MIKFILKLLVLVLLIIGILSINYIFYFVCGVVALSILIMLITFSFSQVLDKDYSFICDQSQLLYVSNKIGRYSSIVIICILVGYVIAPDVINKLIQFWI